MVQEIARDAAPHLKGRGMKTKATGKEDFGGSSGCLLRPNAPLDKLHAEERSLPSRRSGRIVVAGGVPLDQSGQPTANPGDPSLWGANWQAAKGGGAAVHVPRLADTAPRVPPAPARLRRPAILLCCTAPAAGPCQFLRRRVDSNTSSCRVTVSIPHSESSR
jgi:hypothetical protein